MMTNSKIPKKTNSDNLFDTSKLSNLQYIKVVYVGKDKELYEINTKVQALNDSVIRLYIEDNKKFNIACPVGVALKFITSDALYFAKAILKEIKSVNGKDMLILDPPSKVIRQQNRKFCRINLERPCIILTAETEMAKMVYLSKTVNISMGGVLLQYVEPMLDDNNNALQLNKDDCCHMAIMIENNLIVKLYAKYVRSENVDNMQRHAFQFLNIPKRYINPLNKYITNEQLKLLKIIKRK